MDNLHQKRVAVNSARFRRVNNGIAREAHRQRAPSATKYGFVCECAVSECADQVQLTLSEYGAVRINAARFIVRPEHSLPIADRVVYRPEAYWIVEKIEWARHIAEESSTEPTDEIEQLAGALLVEAVNDVRWQEGEYQKAVNHYTQLMRHRVANPLTAICGLTQTLMEMPDLDIETRSEMYHAIYTQCLELLHLSLEPRAISAEEVGLQGMPFE